MKTRFKLIAQNNSQLIIPLLALFLLVIFNLIRDPSFFSISVRINSSGDSVLSGNLISIFNGASELAILAIGMTLVTAASKGQDISVGAAAAIAGSVFVRVLLSGNATTAMIIAAFFISCAVAMIFGAFNGTLVAVFKVQPMIATLILFTIGRAIAYWINGGATPTTDNQWLGYLGGFIPGIPIPTPIFVVILCVVIISLVMKFTNLGLYTQSVGINEKSARLNGIDPIRVKLLAYVILGICVSIAAAINVGRLGLINHETILRGVEMDAILAVAIGGNALSGGKFKLSGSIIGAYIIEGLTNTLFAMKVSSTDIQAYKAVVIIALVVIGSPIVKEKTAGLWAKLFPKREAPAVKEWT